MSKRRILRSRAVTAALALLLTPAVGVASVAAFAGGEPGTGAPTAPAAEEPLPDDAVDHTMAGRPDVRGAFLEHAGPAQVTVTSAKGTVVWAASALSDHGLPVAAEKAYRRAAARMAVTDPACKLPWTLLAGIGRVESDHGRYDGSRLGRDGLSRPRIIGIRLDGTGPVAAIRDSDDGRLDRDRQWDRAVGPMQFIPTTWRGAARDGDGDGRRSPHDLDDAAAAAAAYLCSGTGSLRDPGTQAAAVYRYNQDAYYVALVQAFEVGYRTGVFVMPPPPTDEDEAAEGRERRRDARLAARAAALRAARAATPEDRDRAPGSPAKPKPALTSAPNPKPASKPAPEPAPSPSPKPAPKPSPEPAPPQEASPSPVQVEALLTACDAGWCLGGKPLDLGSLAAAGESAAGDFDGDGATESNGAELAGMAGTTVSMVVVTLESGKLGIYSINGIALG